MSDQGVEINRILERCLKESRCVDTESLCIISGEKVSMHKKFQHLHQFILHLINIYYNGMCCKNLFLIDIG
jgi:hypothetical protein